MTTLSYDGKGINGPDEYRERLATFTNEPAARQYGPLFEAAPELHAALRGLMEYVGGWDSPADHPVGVAVSLLARLEARGVKIAPGLLSD